jgi:hypothetical protein
MKCFVLFWDSSLCDPGWPQTHDPPAWASWMLGLHECTSMPDMVGYLKYLQWDEECEEEPLPWNYPNSLEHHLNMLVVSQNVNSISPYRM